MSTTPDAAFQKQRIAIGLATGLNPPWTNVTFTCANCPAEYQLGCADECAERLQVSDAFRSFDTPPCWDCGHVNIITIPVSAPEPKQIGGS